MYYFGKMKQRLATLGGIAVGIVFLLGAVLKALDFPSFELQWMETLGVRGYLASLLAFATLLIEALLGVYWVVPRLRNRAIDRLGYLFLLALCGYLIYLLIRYGNQIDCGCMSSAIPFTPVQGLLKNAFLLVLLILRPRLVEARPYPKFWWVVIPVALAAMYLSMPSGGLLKPAPRLESSYTLDTSWATAAGVKNFDFNQPKATVLFLSMQCKHCQFAARRLAVSDLPVNAVLVVLNGEPSDHQKFREVHGIERFETVVLNGSAFLNLTHAKVPYVVNLEFGKVVREPGALIF